MSMYAATVLLPLFGALVAGILAFVDPAAKKGKERVSRIGHSFK